MKLFPKQLPSHIQALSQTPHHSPVLLLTQLSHTTSQVRQSLPWEGARAVDLHFDSKRQLFLETAFPDLPSLRTNQPY